MNGENIKRLEQLFFQFKGEIKEDFRHQLGIQTESFQHKLDIVVEGHQMLSDKLDRLEVRLDDRIDCVVKKLDAVAVDLTAHRADTEAHHPVFRVKEPGK